MMSLTTILSSGIICILIPRVAYATPCLFSKPSCSSPSSDTPWYQKIINIDFDLDLDIDITVYKETFTECPYVDNESERDIYVHWMENYSKEQIKQVDTMVKYLKCQRALTTEIKNYEVFKETVTSVYNEYRSKNVYSKEVELSSQRVVFEESKTRIVEAMSCISTESELYSTLSYCTEVDVNMMPIIIGLCKSVAVSQETYVSEYSKCTETSSTKMTKTC